MEDNNEAVAGEVQVKVVDNSDSTIEGHEVDILTNAALRQPTVEATKEEDEENALDGEFIKVEKDVESQTPRHSVANTDILEAQDKIKALECKLEAIAQELQRSESEKTQLKSEADTAKDESQERKRFCEALELDRKSLETEFEESKVRYSLQIEEMQEALVTHEARQKELIGVKESFDGLAVELDGSRKKMEELEFQLQASVNEAQRLEEWSKERDSHAQSESQKAQELERLFESSKLGAKEMEDQMSAIQEELKELYKKVAENQQVEEKLTSTLSELLSVRKELEHSKSLMADLEGKVSSGEATLQELTEELNLSKASEEKLRGDVSALEDLFSASKVDLQAKAAELEGAELKLQEEGKVRETIEESFKEQQSQLLRLQEELLRLQGDKKALEASVSESDNHMLKMRDLCSDLEAKLKASNENFVKSDSLLSQALSNNVELEEKLKSLEALHQESGAVAAIATQKSLELEEIIQASHLAGEEAKSKLSEIETQLISTEQKNLELQQQLSLVELKNADAEREISELQARTAELTESLKGIEEESEVSRCKVLAYDEKIEQLESSLTNMISINQELEKQLKELEDRCGEHEGRTSTSHQRNLELEDLIQVSHSKAEDAVNKVGELELLLQTANFQNQELEEQHHVAETNYKNALMEVEQYRAKLCEVTSELEDFREKSMSLERVLDASNEKERELTEAMNVMIEERKRFEDASINLTLKLSEAENLIGVLQKELMSVQEKLETVEQDLEATGVREIEIVEKLKSAEEQLEEKGKVIEQATTRSLELESMHESLSKDSELKLQEVMVTFSQKDSEVHKLYEKVKSLEDEGSFHKEQAVDAFERAASLKAELESSSVALVALEKTIEELKSNVSETETRAGQFSSENELLSMTNSKLKTELEAHESKVGELQQILSTLHAEKEATSVQLASHMKTISELTDQHSRSLDVQLVSESRIEEAEIQLREAIERFTRKDSEANDLIEKLKALESQVRIYEEQTNEASATAETRKVDLEEALLKLKNLETVLDEVKAKETKFAAENGSLAETNLKLTQELVAYETKLTELQTTLNFVSEEKESTLEQLHSSNKVIEDLMLQLASERERLQSQISSLMEENNLLNETHQGAKRELQEAVIQMEGQLNEQREKEVSLIHDMEDLKAQLAEKHVMQTRIEELKQQLLLAETQSREEINSINSVAANKEAELVSQQELHASKVQEISLLNEKLVLLQNELHLSHATITEQGLEKEATQRSLEEFELKHQSALLLQKQVEELEQKLQLAEAKYNEKDVEWGAKLASVNAELDELKSKSSQDQKLEEKIVELQQQLKLANTLEVQAKVGVEAEVGEIKSRDLRSPISTLSKRKSKKRSEGTNSQAATMSSAPKTETLAEPSHALTFKFIMGVAIVSVIFGIILGKRY